MAETSKNKYNLKGSQNLQRFLEIYIMCTRYRMSTLELVQQYVINEEGIDNQKKSAEEVKVSFWVQFNSAKKEWGLPSTIEKGRQLVQEIMQNSGKGKEMSDKDLEMELVRYILDKRQNANQDHSVQEMHN